ncbi:MAG: hypothetical protein LBN03_01150 [Bifidobacteriaceae bacterium]|jgi:hypothetical protein|nr:hypothetical protein [Bifidobacteriaceae bacterium]
MKFRKLSLKVILFITIFSSIASAVAFFLTNLLFFTKRTPNYGCCTHIIINHSNILILIISSIIILAIVYLLSKLKTISPIFVFILAVFCALFISPFGVIHDAHSLVTFAHNIANNIQPEQDTFDYLQNFPYLLGVSFYEQIVISIFNTDLSYSLIVLDIFNAVMVTFIYIYIKKIILLLFNNHKTEIIFSVLFIGCAPLLLRTNHIYGIIPMLCFAVVSIYYLLKSNTILDRSKALIAISIAETFKPNTLLFILGIIVFLLYRLIQRFNLKNLIILLLFCVVPFFIASIPAAYYEHKIGIGFHNAQPKLVNIQMGLTSVPTDKEGILKNDTVMSSGWFSGATALDENSIVLHSNSEIISNNTKLIIADTENYINNPSVALKFFAKKYISQWGSNDYSVFSQYFGYDTIIMSKFARSVVDGAIYNGLQIYLQGYKLLIGIFSLYSLAILAKSKKITVFLIPFIIAIAAGFYEISEGRDEYVMPFFALMLPYAAYGMKIFFKKVGDYIK